MTTAALRMSALETAARPFFGSFLSASHAAHTSASAGLSSGDGARVAVATATRLAQELDTSRAASATPASKVAPCEPSAEVAYARNPTMCPWKSCNIASAASPGTSAPSAKSI